MKANNYLQDLRSFLEFLESKKQLVRVKQRINLEYEVAGVLFKTLKVGGPALIFENVGKKMQVVGGLIGTRYRLGLALGLSEKSKLNSSNLVWVDEGFAEIVEKIQRAVSEPIPYKKVRSGPLDEVVEGYVNLLKLPVPKWFERNGGAYITGAAAIVKNSITSTLNMGIYRIQVLGKNRLTIYAAPGHDLHAIIEDAEKRGEDVEIAIVIGVDPPTLIAASLNAPPNLSELCVAGSLRGAPLEVVSCKSTDLVVPANAEIVIEGILDPKKKVREGPFGEYNGFYTESFSPLIKVKTIYHRKDPLFHVCMPGPKPGHEGFLYLFRGIFAHKIFEKLKINYPNIKSVALSGYGSIDHLIIVIDKKGENEPTNIIKEVFNMQIDGVPVAWNVRRVTVVDADDICTHDLEEVEFALNSYPRDESSVVIVSNVQSPFDSVYGDRPLVRIGIDATRPLTAGTGNMRIRIPKVNEICVWDLFLR